MTTNTNLRPAARFFVPEARPTGSIGWPVIDRTDSRTVILIGGRQAARDTAKALTALASDTEPQPQPTAEEAATEAKATATRTSHADCGHASSKLARAICRRERAKADEPAEADVTA